jgi:ATP-dependent exoDNAse (exonuclease V) alpha subunit
MGMFHVTVKTIGRNQGASAVGAAAYRSGEKLNDEYYGKTHDYTRKHGIAHTEIFLPPNAPSAFGDRETLWNAVEKAEGRRDARLAREVEIALPIELPFTEQIELVREYVMVNFVAQGMCADVAIHDKRDGNPHVHILLTTRAVNWEGFSKMKNRDWDKRTNVTQWREHWARVQNREFEKRNLTVRVSHESYIKQGIDREPTKHLGRRVMSLERRGIQTDRGNENRAIEARNREREQRDQERQRKRNRERSLERSR